MKKPRVGKNPLHFIQDSRQEADQQAGPQADSQADSQAKKQADSQANQKADSQANQKAGSQANQQAKPQAYRHANLHADLQADLQAVAVKDMVKQGSRPGLLTENRTRRTYWLTKADIEKIDQLAQDSGLTHYQIISTAVNYLYDYVFEEGGE